MEKTFEQYEQNEFAIADTLTKLFNADKIVINPTVNKYEKIDLFFSLHSINGGEAKYAAEIKCRRKLKLGMMIERTKLIELWKEWKAGKRVRYINYIEEDDQLLIFDLNTRFERLELKEVGDNPYKLENYDIIYSPSTTAGNKEYKKKYVKYLYYNPFQTKDYTIDKYTLELMRNNITFIYDGKSKTEL